MIWQQLIFDTRNQSLKWTCGSFSDIWSGTHANYSVRVSTTFPFVIRLTIRTNQNHYYYLDIWYWTWCKIKKLIRDIPLQLDQFSIRKEMKGLKPASTSNQETLA